MKATKEQFDVYEEVRKAGTVDLFDAKAIAKACNVPEEVITDILLGFPAYQYLYGCQGDKSKWSFSKGSANFTSIVLMHFDDLLEVAGQPEAVELPDGRRGIVLALSKQDEMIVFYSFDDGIALFEGDKGLPMNKVVKWYVDASSVWAFGEFWEVLAPLTAQRLKHNKA